MVFPHLNIKDFSCIKGRILNRMKEPPLNCRTLGKEQMANYSEDSSETNMFKTSVPLFVINKNPPVKKLFFNNTKQH